MNKKLLAASALAVLGLLYLAFKPKADVPATVQEEQPLEAPSRSPDDQNLASSLVETLHADKQINEVAIIQSVECADGTCTVELEAKSEENMQPTMMNFLKAHPEYGSSLKIAQGENPRSTQFILSQEKL